MTDIEIPGRSEEARSRRLAALGRLARACREECGPVFTHEVGGKASADLDSLERSGHVHRGEKSRAYIWWPTGRGWAAVGGRHRTSTRPRL